MVQNDIEGTVKRYVSRAISQTVFVITVFSCFKNFLLLCFRYIRDYMHLKKSP